MAICGSKVTCPGRVESAEVTTSGSRSMVLLLVGSFAYKGAMDRVAMSVIGRVALKFIFMRSVGSLR